jgi:hypothetical protein
MTRREKQQRSAISVKDVSTAAASITREKK